MKSGYILLLFVFVSLASNAQVKAYTDSLIRFQKEYVATHEVVKSTDKNHFRFYKVDKSYHVVARFSRITDSTGFIMRTSGIKTPRYFRYGLLHFKLRKNQLVLTVYQSEKLMADSSYKNYLFVPFTDLSSGEKSYAGGRYMDFVMDDIKNDSLEIDFNKAYNPYCAYSSGYNCPIPPAENNLPVAIEAGEMEFAKKH